MATKQKQYKVHPERLKYIEYSLNRLTWKIAAVRETIMDMLSAIDHIAPEGQGDIWEIKELAEWRAVEKTMGNWEGVVDNVLSEVIDIRTREDR